MTPEDLLVVAQDLLVAQGPGAPLGARIRRSISSSYYAVFHAALELIDSQAAGVTGHPDIRDAMRRATAHKQIADAAREIVGVPRRGNPQIAPRRRSYKSLSTRLHTAGWGLYMQDVIDLQEQREVADYDLTARPRRSDATLAISKARRTTAFLLGHKTGGEGSAFFALVTAQQRI